MANPVNWFEIYVQDLPRARAFYERVLGVKLMKLELPEGGDGGEMWAFPMDEGGGGASGSLVHMTGVPSGSGGTMVYFSCTDCATEAGRVEAAGGKVYRPKFSIGPYGFIALAVDPDGNMIGLHSSK